MRAMHRFAFILLLLSVRETTDALRCCTGAYQAKEIVGETNLCEKSDLDMCVSNTECTLKYHIRKHALHNVTQECGEEKSSDNENTLRIPTAQHICTMYFEAQYNWSLTLNARVDRLRVPPDYILFCRCSQQLCNVIRPDILELWRNAIELDRRFRKQLIENQPSPSPPLVQPQTDELAKITLLTKPDELHMSISHDTTVTTTATTTEASTTTTTASTTTTEALTTTTTKLTMTAEALITTSTASTTTIEALTSASTTQSTTTTVTIVVSTGIETTAETSLTSVNVNSSSESLSVTLSGDVNGDGETTTISTQEATESTTIAAVITTLNQTSETLSTFPAVLNSIILNTEQGVNMTLSKLEEMLNNGSEQAKESLTEAITNITNSAPTLSTLITLARNGTTLARERLEEAMSNITSNMPAKAAETLFTAIFGERDASKETIDVTKTTTDMSDYDESRRLDYTESSSATIYMHFQVLVIVSALFVDASSF